MIPALEYHRSLTRYVAARGMASAGRLAATAIPIALSLAPLRLVHREEPARPGPQWCRVRPLLSGICGSDLALLTGQISPYLSPLVSTPFVPGHEIVGELVDASDGLAAGTTVVIDPVLSCRTRGVAQCRSCAAGWPNRCEHVSLGDLPPGLQTGFCTATGGGWSRTLIAHRDQVHPVPDSLPLDRAVLAEPLACAVHGVRSAQVSEGAVVAVIGGGALGLFTVLALARLTRAATILSVAKYQHQRERAVTLGATDAIDPARAVRRVRRATGGLVQRPDQGREYLLGGADVAFICTGGSSGIETALRLVRGGGQVVLSGVPADRVDLTPLWYRELTLVGTYASVSPGPRTDADGGEARPGDFATAIKLAAEAPLDGCVEGHYRLDDWQDALTHALAAGRTGSIRVAFAPQLD